MVRGRLGVGVHVARQFYESYIEKQFHIASCSETLFFLLENWQARESTPVLEIQFNLRNDGVLTAPVKEVLKVPTGARSFGP